jgi:hypothetical protein
MSFTKTAFFRTLLLAAVFDACLVCIAQTRPDLASVSTVQLNPNTSMNLVPKSEVGIILVAIDTCLLEVNGVPVTLEPGQRKFVHGRHAVTVSQDATNVAVLVVINVASASQELTFDKTELTPGNELIDASNRGNTLLIALSPLKLLDRRNEAKEDEHPRWGSPLLIDLERGQFTWIEPGVHQVRNRGDGPARFLTIEW